MNSSKKIIILILIIVSALTRNIPNQILGISFTGQWQQEQNNSIFKIPLNKMINNYSQPYVSFLNNIKGQSELMFYISQKLGELQPKADRFYIQLYDQKYRSSKMIVFDLKVNQFWNQTQQKWIAKKFATIAHLYENYQQLIRFQINLDFQISYQINEQKLSCKISSDSLTIEILAQKVSYIEIPIIWLSLILLQFIVLYCYQPKQASDSARLLGTSQWILTQSVGFFITTAALSIKIAFAKYDTQLKWLLLVGLFNCALSLYLLRKFQPVLEKFFNSRYLILGLGFLISYWLISFFYYTSTQYWLIQSMLFLWQIGYSMLRGGKGGLSYYLISVILLSRVPLYYVLTHDNIFRIKPSIPTFYIIVGVQIIHIIILKLQSKNGGRFLIINEMIPDYYDYYRKKSIQDQVLKNQCSICLVALNKEPNQHLQNSSASLQMPSQTDVTVRGRLHEQIIYMQAPCMHIFHKKCLSDWMQIKLCCPLDRSTLPPISEML